MGKPAHTAVSPLPLARNVSQKTSLLTRAVFVDDTWAAAQLKTVLPVNKGCTNYCQMSDHHVTKDNEMWWFESLKRDNSIFRTRFTTVMISLIFFSPCFSLQSMAQFKWFDGTVKNVHVDPTLLFDYQVCIITLFRTMPAF